MNLRKKKIVMVIYANLDYYPPMISAINILAKEFDIIVFCRNLEALRIDYPANARIFRLGKLKTCKEQETQGRLAKFFEYISFVLRIIIYAILHDCQLIYSYDAHALMGSFLAAHINRRIPLIYHNFEISEMKNTDHLSWIIRYLELKLVRFAQKAVFADINRARFFQGRAKLVNFPAIVMNTPLRVSVLPDNKLKEIIIRRGFDAQTRVILYQGTICKEASILHIIRSMAFWPKNSVFVLGGFVEKRFIDDLEHEASAQHVSARVIRLPLLPYSELFSYTIGAYLGLALFNSDDINRIYVAGASNKIFEYLALGIPVITNDSPYFREVIDSSLAYYAKPDSPEDIAKVVNLAFSDREEYHKKSQAARQAHLTGLNYQEQFKPILDYIRGVVNK